MRLFVAVLFAATIGVAGQVNAYPSGVMHANTATAASHKFTYGDSDDRIQTQVRCANLSGGILYRNGPWVGRGVWSQVYCPSGYYRAQDIYLLKGTP